MIIKTTKEELRRIIKEEIYPRTTIDNDSVRKNLKMDGYDIRFVSGDKFSNGKLIINISGVSSWYDSNKGTAQISIHFEIKNRSGQMTYYVHQFFEFLASNNFKKI